MAGDLTRAEPFFAVFDVSHIQETVLELHAVEKLARERGRDAFVKGINQIILNLLIDLRALGVRYSAAATEAIKRRIEATRAPNRPAGHEMETHIRSEPGPFGSVGVAMLSELNKIINAHNPRWTNPFWIAQEHGTGATIEYGPGVGGQVPSQEDRPIFGTFYDSESPPDAAQAGLRVGRDQFFLPMGSAPGLGRISVELPARHFLRDGTEETAAKWLEAFNVLDRNLRRDLERLTATTSLGATRRVPQTIRRTDVF